MMMLFRSRSDDDATNNANHQPSHIAVNHFFFAIVSPTPTPYYLSSCCIPSSADRYSRRCDASSCYYCYSYSYSYSYNFCNINIINNSINNNNNNTAGRILIIHRQCRLRHSLDGYPEVLLVGKTLRMMLLTVTLDVIGIIVVILGSYQKEARRDRQRHRHRRPRTHGRGK